MAGLFDTINLGANSLATYRKAIDVTGHNLANVNTPGYTRQRLLIESTTVDGGAWGVNTPRTELVLIGVTSGFDREKFAQMLDACTAS